MTYKMLFLSMLFSASIFASENNVEKDEMTECSIRALYNAAKKLKLVEWVKQNSPTQDRFYMHQNNVCLILKEAANEYDPGHSGASASVAMSILHARLNEERN